MIFATVGSISFDDLVRTLDQAVASGAITLPVTIQIANGSYVPRHTEFFRTAPGLVSYLSSADLVISHGGATNLEVLSMRKRLVSVANPALADSHQDEFLRALEGVGATRYCRNLAELPRYIRDALEAPPPIWEVDDMFRRPALDLEALPPRVRA